MACWPGQANKMVLGSAPFRLASVIEAAMEIVGLQAAIKRLQVPGCASCSLPGSCMGTPLALWQRHSYASWVSGSLHARDSAARLSAPCMR